MRQLDVLETWPWLSGRPRRGRNVTPIQERVDVRGAKDDLAAYPEVGDLTIAHEQIQP